MTRAISYLTSNSRGYYLSSISDEKTEAHRSWIACPCHRARFRGGFELKLYNATTHSPSYYTIRLLLQTKQSGIRREYMWTPTVACEEYRTREKVRAQELAHSASTDKMSNNEGAWEQHPAQLMEAPETGTLSFISALQCLAQSLLSTCLCSEQWGLILQGWTGCFLPDRSLQVLTEGTTGEPRLLPVCVRNRKVTAGSIQNTTHFLDRHISKLAELFVTRCPFLWL